MYWKLLFEKSKLLFIKYRLLHFKYLTGINIIVTLDYWIDDGWFVGKLIKIPEIFSQGQTLEELMINIKEVYQLGMD